MKLTVYSNAVAIAKQEVRMDFSTAGEIENLRWDDVPSGMDPLTVSYSFPETASVKVRQQRWVNLGGSNGPIESLIGEDVKFTDDSGKVISGKLLSTNPSLVQVEGGDVVISPNGTLSISSDLVGPRLLLWVQSLEAGSFRCEMTYSITGVTWSPHYVARIHEGGRVDFTGWVTVFNEGGIDCEGVQLSVVEDVGFGSQVSYDVEHPVKMYPNIPSNIAVVNSSIHTNQRRFLSPAEHRDLVFDVVVVPNEEGGELGVSLPKGMCRVQFVDADGNEYIMSDCEIGPFVSGSSIEIPLSEASGIVGIQRWIGEDGKMNVVADNRSDYSVEVLIEEVGPANEVTWSTVPAIPRTDWACAFPLTLQPKQSVGIQYRCDSITPLMQAPPNVPSLELNVSDGSEPRRLSTPKTSP